MKKIRICSKNGIHARPASLIIKEAQGFESEIYLIKNGTQINCKSIMNILSMGIGFGDDIEISAIGSDAEQAELSVLSVFEKINRE